MSKLKEQPGAWRNLPVEDREQFYQRLRKENTSVIDRPLSRLEVALACGIEPDPWQRDLLVSEDQQLILNCCRQSGKSTVSALIASHELCYKPDSLTLVFAPTEKQSQETYRKIRAFYNQLSGVPGVFLESNKKIELVNGSRALVLPGKEANVRGFSGVSLLIVDEASRVDDNLYEAIRPMLAVSQGRIILLSTPFGMRGFFWREWTDGRHWKRVKVPAVDCPRISKEWLDEERQRMGSMFFSQEFECNFADCIESCFSSADILAAFRPEVLPWWPETA